MERARRKLAITKRGLLLAFSIVCLLFAAVYVVIDDTLPIQLLSETDFLFLFYVAGTIIRNGFGGQLYPPAGSHDYVHAFFNQYAAKVLPGVHHFIPALLLYPPPVALFFVPFSYLAPRTALILWQVLSFLAMYVASFLFSGGLRGSFFNFAIVFSLLPMVHIVLWGQPTIIFVFVPLVAGYLFWKRGNNFAAGLVWSLIWFKAQLLIPLIAINVAWLLSAWRSNRAQLRSAVQFALGLACGTAVLAVASIWLVAPGSIGSWLSCVRGYSKMFTTGEIEIGALFAGTIASAYNFFVPANYAAMYFNCMSVVVAVALALLFVLNYRLLSSKWPWSLRQDLCVILALGALPLSSIYFRSYDLGMWVLILWIYLYKLPEGNIKKSVRQLIIVSWIAMDLFFSSWTWIPAARMFSVIMLTCVSVMYVRLFLLVWKELKVNPELEPI